jgi:antitoxin (DNA-binding transcriptional repressor) of toxin-antitoxin stability system
MKTASIHNLRYHFSAREEHLRAGEAILITKRNPVVARLLPASPRPVKIPDFRARMKKTFWKQANESLRRPANLGTARRTILTLAETPAYYKIFTARAASSATMVSEISDCTIIPSLAQRDNAAVSVGENAVLVLNARNK